MHALPPLAVFTSEDAHYSVVKMATLMGLGAESVLLVRTDARGRMQPEHLEQLVAEARGRGARPFLVSATAGTTVLGAYDPIEALAAVCRKNRLWLHVDAAWGGGALMSRRHRHLLRGVHLADSVSEATPNTRHPLTADAKVTTGAFCWREAPTSARLNTTPSFQEHTQKNNIRCSAEYFALVLKL